MPDRPARVFGYCRVSSRDQDEHGTSLESQEAAIRREAARLGCDAPVLRIEVESGGPDAEELRDVQRQLVDEARPGDVVLVGLVDRWSRDAVYTLRSVRELVARGVGWRSVHEHVDAATPHGDEVLGYRALAADHERRRIVLRTVGRRRELLELGYWALGAHPPFGYRRGSGPGKLAHLVLEPAAEDAALVVEAHQRTARGASVVDVQAWLQDERPDRGWSLSVVKQLLRSRVYLGEIRAPSGWVRGQHPAIVDADLWARSRAAAASRDKGGRRASASSRTASWLVRGPLAFCGHCGAPMRSAYGRDPSWNYLACRDACGASFARVADVDAAVAELVLARLRELRRELATPPPRPARAPKPRDYAGERKRLEAALERAQRLAVDGLLEADALRRERDRVRTTLDALAAAEAAEARAVREASPEVRRELLADVRRLERAWARAPVDVRRQVLHQLAERVVLRAEEAPEVKWRSVAELLVDR